ncbi:hypothetical protein Nepgr_031336 [Nepenthes gracilis]|uniref:Uncharacterized protein n=1 Tax=Nepenthes gracilis TaxID=150966 RepID=A0AAD3TGC4_NEPGR|nr:hypothetical protein Nepgr_031336 [Nepenthes gracilis]
MVLMCCGPGVADLALKLYLIDCYRIDADAQHACVRETSVLDAGAGEIGVALLCTLGYKFCVLETEAVTAAVGIAVLQPESWCCLCCRFPHAFWGLGGGTVM